MEPAKSSGRETSPRPSGENVLPDPLVVNVDVDEAGRHGRSHELRRAGFQVVEASSGADCLRLAVENQPALIVLDTRLPDIDGFEVCERLKSDPATAPIPVLHVSRSGLSEIEFPKSLRHRSDAYLREPIEPDTLIATAVALMRAGEAERRSRAAEERARQAERHAAGILESIADPVIAFDKHWRYTYVSRRAAILLGKSSEEMLGRSMWELFPQDTRTGFQQACERAWADGIPVIVERYSNVLGAWLESYIYPLQDGAVTQWRDISARKIAQEELVESQKRLELALEAAELGTWQINLADGSLAASTRTCAIFDFDEPSSRVEDWFLRLHPDDREGIQRQIQHAIADATRFEVEQRVIARDGSTRWVYSKAVPVKGAPGVAARLIGVAQDVTARKQAEQGRERERELRQGIIDNIPVMLCLYDPDLREFELNRECERVVGWTTDDANAADFLSLVYPDPVYRKAATDHMQSVSPGWREWDVRAKDGTVVPSQWANIRLPGDRMIGIGIDIRERKQAESALRESEERLLLALGGAQIGTFEYRPYTGEFYADERTKAQLGLWPDAPLTAAEVIRRIHPEDEPRVRKTVRAAMEATTDLGFELEYRIVWPDGSIHWGVTKGRVYIDPKQPLASRLIGIHLDTSERKQLEEQLRQRLEELETVMELVPAAIWVAQDPECTTVFGNRMANQLFDAAPGENVSLGFASPEAPGRRRFFRDGRELQRQDLPIDRAAAGNSEVQDQELEVLLPSGVRKTLWGNASPLRDTHGRVRGCVGAFLDTTVRKQYEEELLHRKQEYETLAENAPEVIARFDRQGRHIYINKHGAKVYGVSKESVLGKTAVELGFPAELIKLWQDRCDQVLAEGRVQTLEFEFDSPELGYQCSSSLLVPEFDVSGSVESILAITRDVTELRRAEQGVLASERRLKAVIENLAEGLIVIDPLTRTVNWNRTALEMHGYRSQNDIPSDRADIIEAYEFRDLRREVLPPSEWPVDRLLREGSLRDCELLVRDKRHGWERVFSYGGTVVGDEPGVRNLALLTVRDITEKMRTEERLRQSQKLESLGLLAGGIAHDFNNLLTGIMGNASMVLEDVEPAAAARIREVIGSAERAAHLTRQLLAYSGKGQFIVRDLDLSRAVNEISDMAQFSIPKSVDLVLNLQKRLPVVRMDPSQFQQVIMNLVINAGEAIGEGKTGKVAVSTGVHDVMEPFVDAVGRQIDPGRYVSVEVSDTGGGIDELKKSRIFDPFFTTKFTGRGLGLAAVAGIVRSLDGAILVESSSGHGSTFRVLLPAAHAAAREKAPGADAETRGTVLVVDDERSVRDFINAVLRREGYRVLAASDGKEALAVFDEQEGRIDAVVLDIVMPVMTAGELLPRMKERQPLLKVLLTSGYSESEARRLCAAYPGAAFVQKPYTAQEIARRVQDLMRSTG